MNLHDLKAGGGCPRCVGDASSFHWSGGPIEVREVLAGGAERIDRREDGTGWPAWERARCLSCGAVWDFEFHWHDHPPLVLTGRVVGPDGAAGP